jgi:DNA-binding protein YbaB
MPAVAWASAVVLDSSIRLRGSVSSYEDAFDLVGLRELQREAAELARGFSVAADPAARVDGFDGSRTVRMTIDGSGRVVDVEIGRSWRAVIGPAGLGPAVVEAVHGAERRRVETWADAAERNRAMNSAGDPGGQADLSGLSSSDSGGSGPAPPPGDRAAADATRELFYLAMDVMERLDDVARTVEQGTGGPVRGDSPGGRVMVTVEAGRLTGVEFDQRWLADAGAEAIAEQVLAGFAAAYRADPRTAVADALEHPTFRELREVTADPHELLRRLGLG